ncbi:similar to An02g01810 [Aspergillus luchuensis]|uniref:Similar to An02g01810 n=1 Tax=Aspergillus kawachii TaxID=1069201 RepID=A0A146EZ01_ASPKA|nr:similar to An02g01810 [Aspergillus luchuensis]
MVSHGLGHKLDNGRPMLGYDAKIKATPQGLEPRAISGDGSLCDLRCSCLIEQANIAEYYIGFGKR